MHKMSEIKYKFTHADDIEMLMDIRLEMLKEVNGLTSDYEYDKAFVANSRDYFLSGDHTSVLALCEGKVVGCASMCYMTIMPTFSHPTGKRAHLMNVYTSKVFRGQGIAKKMVEMLINEAWKNSATEISLDATKAGRPLYEKLGFAASEECMVLSKS